MIYTLCLPKDCEIFPYAEEYAPVKGTAISMGRDVPITALPIVSKSVSAEATSFLYSRNTWRIGPSLSSNHYRISKSWDSNKHLVRHLVLHVTHYDVPKTPLDYIWSVERAEGFEDCENDVVVAFIHKALTEKGGRQSICRSMRCIFDSLGVLFTLAFEMQDLFLSPTNRTLRLATLRALLCLFQERVVSLGALGCVTTVRGLQDEEEKTIVQGMWPFAVAETSAPKLQMW